MLQLGVRAFDAKFMPTYQTYQPAGRHEHVPPGAAPAAALGGALLTQAWPRCLLALPSCTPSQCCALFSCVLCTPLDRLLKTSLSFKSDEVK